ncbi:flap endonuclease-1 [Candidatus Woesearchaeota archaeon CG10_big_fil_rev_8_21_14_0_10_34_12]|nr:MAG: flap endonuclease-1 [Candidatus Woesearchaeota archaeon CG10_big_fil_rev_8_21_14_0_10_34_12]
MGLQISDIVTRKQIEFSELRGKVLAVDAFNVIYQFLSTIRQPDGTPLMDSKKRVTSHLSGLFYRNIALLQEGIKLVYVFDGIPPEQKIKTHRIRQEIRDGAREKYEDAKEKGDEEGMGKYARQLARLNDEMIQDSKELLEAMGIAVIQAPSEGEAQAAWLAKHNKVYAVASQDYDSLLFGTPRLIQNMTLSRKRKTVSGWIYISPEMLELEKLLNNLQINLDQLICLGILVGTDYNPKGVFRIGQKKALDIVKRNVYPVKIFEFMKEQIENQEETFDWQEIFQLFHKPNIKEVEEIKFPKIDEKKIKKILMEHDFSEERIDSQLEKLKEIKEKAKQKTLI